MKIVSIILGVILVAGALGHFVAGEFYGPMIPEFIPTALANYGSGIAEAVIGIALFMPKYRKLGGLGFMLLMIAFLPIHIWDLFKEVPAIGPHPAPIIRLVFQFVLIGAGFWIFRAAGKRNG